MRCQEELLQKLAGIWHTHRRLQCLQWRNMGGLQVNYVNGVDFTPGYESG